MRKILVANRGEIAVRIIDTCRKMNIRSVAVYSDADRSALHVQLADEAVCIGPAPAAESYLNQARVLQAAAKSRADGIHPGYGFLSENAEFARAVQARGLIWIGPTPAAMEAMASKVRAREIALAHAVPVPGAASLDASQQPDMATIAALGFPLLVKASAGGGGIGMRVVNAADELEAALAEARTQAQRQFGDASLLIERLLANARHVEVQVVGDQHGNLLQLFDRDCSLQRRRQKLVEEAPAPGLSESLRAELHSAALRLAAAVDYQGVGTVEFLVQGERFFLLEMNTRLQVEHPVTEAILGLDLVQMQIDIASGHPLALTQAGIIPRGHAIEARIYAEDPRRQFAPASGAVSALDYARTPHCRVDTGMCAGSVVSHHYDGLMCKVIASGADRASAVRGLRNALDGLHIAGPDTNQRFLQVLLQDSAWLEGAMYTTLVEENLPSLLSLSEIPPQHVEAALMAATVWQFLRQPPDADKAPWPGGFQYQRVGHWQVNGEKHSVNWRWAGRASFQFFDPDHIVRLASSSAADGKILELECDGFLRRYRFHAEGDSVNVHEPSIGAISLLHCHSDSQRERTQDPTRCASAGPGLVLDILVEPGQTIAAGDALLVIESMKMETTLSAGCSGQVQTISTQAGAVVETGQLLVTIAPATEGNA
jgi:acetyl/propionyl-CoA carboxylase alpha subunit